MKIEDLKTWTRSKINNRNEFATNLNKELLRIFLFQDNIINEDQKKVEETKLISLFNEVLRKYVANQDEQAEKFIIQLRKKINESVQALDGLDINEEKGKNISFDLLFNFQDLVFFPKENIKDTFPEVGLKQILKWFIPVDKITAEIDKINSCEGAYLPKYLALYYINEHLKFKLLDELLLLLGQSGLEIRKKKGEDAYNNFYQGIHRMSRNKKISISKSDKKLFKGQTEKNILKDLYNSVLIDAACPLPSEVKSKKVYELFKLIMPDKMAKFEQIEMIYKDPEDQNMLKKEQHAILKTYLGF
ncbi:MAG: hypothetical protein M3R27_14560 [Bacteroidota bacterium]|nr:hypothetical protein [Bacteroidota bacterium]